MSSLTPIEGVPGELHVMPKTPLQTRWYTAENVSGDKGGGGRAKFGRKGSPAIGIAVGDRKTIADIRGSGTIRRVWLTTYPRMPATLRGVKIEAFWDDCETPAVQAPLGDFFCHSLGHMVPFENACFSSPEGRSFNCCLTMPFRKRARIVVTNEGTESLTLFYDIACTLGDRHDQDVLYFHAYWRRENMTALRRDMIILPRVEGRGRFLGCHLGTRLHPACAHFWWGEGEVKVYLDGDAEYPTLCGTGTEDYVGSGWGQDYFVNKYQGNQFVSKNKDAFGFYRFHIPDPIYFHKDIWVAIQVMGGPTFPQLLEAMDKDPTMKFMKPGDGSEYYTREEVEAHPERAEVIETIQDYCATAYWYMDKPANALPPIAGAAERMKDL